MADILTTLVAEGPPPSWPGLLVVACRDATEMTGVGLALVDGAGIGGVLAATGGTAEQLEDLQFTLGEGPCVEASRTGRPVLCPDLPADGGPRWPAFTSGAAELGVSASFTFPLLVGAVSIGVLDLYRAERGPLRDMEQREAVAFSDAAVAVLLHLHEQGEARGMAGDGDGGRPSAPGRLHDGGDLRAVVGLTDLVGRRAVVHQAAGMISVQLGVGVAEALLRLRAHAWAQRRTIAEVAAEVVARRLRFDDSQNGTAAGFGGLGPDGSPGREPQ